jgi:mannosyltransferase
MTAAIRNEKRSRQPTTKSFAINWGLIGLTFFGFALRLYRLDYQSLWRDEVDSILVALTASLNRLWGVGFNGPLYYLLMHGWVAQTGRSEFATRLNASLWSTLAIPLVFLLGCQLVGKRPAFLAALLVTTSPYLIWYGQEVKMYALLVSLVLLALYCYRRALRGEGTIWWVGTAVGTSLSFYVHILAPLLIPLEILWFFAVRERPWKEWLLTMALLTLPYLPLVLWQAPLIMRGYSPGHPFVPFPRMLTMLLVGWSRGVAGGTTLGVPLLTFFVFLLLVGVLLVRADRSPQGRALPSYLGRWRDEVLPLLLHLAVPTLALYLISLRSPIFTDRYLIWVAPAFYLLIGRGLYQIFRRGPIIGSLMLALVLALNLQGVWQQTHTPIKSDFRAAAAYFAAQRSEGDLVIFLIPYNHFTFEYYYHQLYNLAQGPYTNRGQPEEEIAGQMEAITADYRTVWLVASEVEMWDRRGLVRAWLQEHGQPADEAQFTRVSLYRYTLK